MIKAVHRWCSAFVALLLTLLLSTCSQKQSQNWPAWQFFKEHYISSEGRVIDSSDPRHITTSEGQSYALFFALVANDPVMFSKLIQWTEANLAAGNLRRHLPAWLWGKTSLNQWAILDKNSASDADLWIAYDLIEAGRLWNNPQYQNLGYKILELIAAEEVSKLPGMNFMLLPWKKTLSNNKTWILNPSYTPPQLLQRFSEWPGPWNTMVYTNTRFLIDTSPKGLSPDWMIWDKQKGWLPDKEHPYVGSYNAIRVYLWIGMLAPNAPDQKRLMNHVQPMVQLTERLGKPPRVIYSNTGLSEGQGPVGFSAALLPLLAASRSPALESQRAVIAKSPYEKDAYYNSVLKLFGEGFDEGRFHFDMNGNLIPFWK